MSEFSISSELIDHLIALAQSRHHARQPGQWMRFIGRLEALRTVFSTDAAVAGFLRSHEAAHLAEAIGWLERLARLMPQRTTDPIHRYWPFNHFQTLLGEPIARAMNMEQCEYFVQVLLNRTALEFDPPAYHAADGSYAPWRDPANGVEFKNRWNLILVSFRPLDHWIFTERLLFDKGDGPWLKPAYEARAAEWLLAEEEKKRQPGR